MAAPDGLLIVDKPTGWTSHDVVGRVRRLAATRKVGHAGTLDPMATGVLVLGIGRATRLLGHLALTSKGYDATIRLGQSTVTDDAEGDMIDARDAGGLSDETILAAVEALRGDIAQVPSSVSAVKVNGERAYKRVRAGADVVLAPRPVYISSLEIVATQRQGPIVDLDVHVECSTGTYVRALARDLGQALDAGGHLTMLRRTRVGRYEAPQAASLHELAELSPEALPVIGLDRAAVDNFATHVIAAEEVAGIRNGRTLSAQLPSTQPEQPVAVLAPDGEFLALYDQQGAVAKAVAVFAPA